MPKKRLFPSVMEKSFRNEPLCGARCGAIPNQESNYFNNSMIYTYLMAEEEGFEPSVGYSPTHAFQACALNHSAILPHCLV